MDPLLPHSFGGHWLSHISSFVDNSRYIYVPGSLALQEAFNCMSKFAGLVIWFAGSSSNMKQNLPGHHFRSHSICSNSSTQLKHISSVRRDLTAFFRNSRYRRKSAIPVVFGKISSFALKQICKQAERLQSFPVLSLAAALVPPFTNVPSYILAAPLETSSVEAQICMDQRSCEIENRGCGPCTDLYLQSLAWSKTVEPRTGVEFPTMLDKTISGQSNSSFTPEVLVGTGSRTMTIVRIKSLKVYAFGFYVHPFDVCEKLGPKYACIPEYELNKRQDFYQDLLSAFEKSLRARLLRTNPDADFSCLQKFGSMFSQDISLHVLSCRRITEAKPNLPHDPLRSTTTLLFLASSSKNELNQTFYHTELHTCKDTGNSFCIGIHGIGLGLYKYIITCHVISRGLTSVVHADFNYKVALKKSIIFLEAQRDLVGGYYDAGDNVKYCLPMAFTVTTLAWAAISYKSELQAAREMENVLAAVRWGTDYLLKASSRRDPEKDDACRISPENMKTPRTVLKIDRNTPGTEISETCSALAAASMVFRRADHAYARRLLNRAKVSSSLQRNTREPMMENEELLWAATWLYKATRRSTYIDYIQNEAISAAVSEFSWDLKYAGAQILLSQFYMEGQKDLHSFKEQADSFVCSILPDSPYHLVYISPGGLLHLRDGANTQYVTGTDFLFSDYSDLLAKHKQVICGDKKFGSDRYGICQATGEMDYILGKNPRKRSYMVGFGNKPPTQAHHRGSSVPRMPPNKEVNCGMSFVYWYNTNEPNPNELTGAIVGGPDKNDNFEDKLANSPMTEPTTYINSLAVGVLAKLARHSHAR
ncbi:Endoglucanase 16 [Sesamum angolense]|uniref:Endoglucanase n=1 Tax=Sesamum angolense TaxID=2727404 RepID=A0AAE1W8U1_9LAMI|nr:Endoglucanase 16 [Sesamum angolense]